MPLPILSHHLARLVETPPLDDQRVAYFCRRGGIAPPVYVPVEPLPGANPGYAYWNVAAAMQEGDELEFGWNVSWWRDRFIQAVHHAVLVRKGRRIDVTPSDRPNAEQILFVPLNWGIDFGRGQRVQKFVEPLWNHPSLALWIAYDLTIDREQGKLAGLAHANKDTARVATVVQALEEEWAYVQEEMMHAVAAANEYCLCGSGETYKRCHGRDFPDEASARAHSR